MYNSYFNILTGTAHPRGEEFVILGAIASTITKSSKENVTEISRRLKDMVSLADT